MTAYEDFKTEMKKRSVFAKYLTEDQLDQWIDAITIAAAGVLAAYQMKKKTNNTDAMGVG